MNPKRLKLGAERSPLPMNLHWTDGKQNNSNYNNEYGKQQTRDLLEFYDYVSLTA